MTANACDASTQEVEAGESKFKVFSSYFIKRLNFQKPKHVTNDEQKRIMSPLQISIAGHQLVTASAKWEF